MVMLNTLHVLRRPALDTQRNAPVVRGEFYSVFAVRNEVDQALSHMFHQHYWQHIDDYSDYAKALAIARTFPDSRVVKVIPHNTGYYGHII